MQQITLGQSHVCSLHSNYKHSLSLNAAELQMLLLAKGAHMMAAV